MILPAQDTDIFFAREVSRKVLQQSANAEAKEMEEGKLKSEFEKEILARIEDKFKRSMLEKGIPEMQQKTDALGEGEVIKRGWRGRSSLLHPVVMGSIANHATVDSL